MAQDITTTDTTPKYTRQDLADMNHQLVVLLDSMARASQSLLDSFSTAESDNYWLSMLYGENRGFKEEAESITNRAERMISLLDKLQTTPKQDRTRPGKLPGRPERYTKQ